MSKFLFLDTSKSEARIRILGENGVVEYEHAWDAHRILGATLSENILKLLSRAKLTFADFSGIVIFPGPGSFTGLRIGISYVNALAYGLNIPIYEADENGNFDTEKALKIATPIYGAEPNITKPKERP